MAPPSSSQGIEETVKDGDVRGSAFAGCAAPCDVRLGPGPGLRSADGRLWFGRLRFVLRRSATRHSR